MPYRPELEIRSSNERSFVFPFEHKRNSSGRLIWIAVLLIIFCGLAGNDSISGQDPDDKTRNTLIELSKLDTFLKNRDGDLIQYFNITFEEFERVYNALNSAKRDSVSDSYSIRSVKIINRVRDQSVQMEIEFKIHTRTDALVDIPIHLENTLFPPTADNANVVRHDDRYFFRLAGKKNVEQTIRLSGLQRTTRTRTGKQLVLDLPPATYSVVEIHDTMPNAVFSAPQETISQPITSVFSGGSAIEITGLKNRASITWRTRNKRGMEPAGRVEKDLSVTAMVTADEVRYSARFSVSGPEPFSSIRIGLPRNAQQVSLQSETGTLSESGQTSPAWKIYQLEFDRQSNRFPDLEISWTVPLNDRAASLVGFEILDFFHEGGQLTVQSDNGINFALSNRFNLGAPNTVVENRHYSFRISTPIFSARLFTLADAVATEIQGDAQIELSPDRLTMSLVLPSTGADDGPADLSIRLNGWSLRSGQPGIQLDNASGDARISPVFFLTENSNRKIELFRPINKLGELKLEFPRISNLTIDSWRITLSCTEELICRIDAGKNPQFDWRSGNESMVVSSAQRQVMTSPSSHLPILSIRLDPVRPFIDARRQLKLIEAQGRFEVHSRTEIHSSRDFASLVVNSPVAVETMRVDGKEYNIAGMIPSQGFRIDLPAPKRNIKIDLIHDVSGLVADSFQWKLTRFYLPTRSGTDESSDAIQIQGVNYSPVVIESELIVTTPNGTHIVPDSDWNALATGSSPNHDLYRGGTLEHISFQYDVLPEDDVAVHKAWCQTSLNDSFRQDRIVIRFSPRRSLIQWQMPDGSQLVECYLDGLPLSLRNSDESSTLETGFSDFSREYVIEFYLRYFHAPQKNHLSLALPKTSRLTWCRQIYWHVRLPDNRYILNYSSGLTADYVLDWTGFFLRPQPRMTLKQLDRWIGTTEEIVPGESGNDYLFSTFGIGDQQSVLMISKRNLVLIFGLFFISLGCAFVSLSIMRNALTLVMIAAGILILGIWYPIWFIQLLQIELFVAFLFAVGIMVRGLLIWLLPMRDETRIETNVPSLVLAAPDSAVNASAETRSLHNPPSGESP